MRWQDGKDIPFNYNHEMSLPPALTHFINTINVPKSTTYAS